MRIQYRLLTILLLISCVDARAAFAQDVELRSPRLSSLAESLASHGLTDLSEESLLAALSSSDPQVRTLAAMKLEEDHREDAAPAIESVLSREQDLKAQIGLSEALWGLHDDHGAPSPRPQKLPASGGVYGAHPAWLTPKKPMS